MVEWHAGCSFEQIESFPLTVAFQRQCSVNAVGIISCLAQGAMGCPGTAGSTDIGVVTRLTKPPEVVDGSKASVVNLRGIEHHIGDGVRSRKPTGELVRW